MLETHLQKAIEITKLCFLLFSAFILDTLLIKRLQKCADGQSLCLQGAAWFKVSVSCPQALLFLSIVLFRLHILMGCSLYSNRDFPCTHADTHTKKNIHTESSHKH